MDPSACDIGCDEYGYPARAVPVSPAGYAAGMVPNREDFWALEWTPQEIASMRLLRRIKDLETVIECLSASLDAVTAKLNATPAVAAPPPRTMPARALFCQRMVIGVRS